MKQTFTNRNLKQTFLSVHCVLSIMFFGLLSSLQGQNLNYQWAKSIGGLTGGTDMGRSIAVDVSGNVYVAGDFSGTVDFDPSSSTANLTSFGNGDVFLAKYDASGNYVWAKNMGGTFNELGYDLVVDGSGNVYITGNFMGTADFDPSAASANLTVTGGSFSDIFLAKYDAAGNYLWAKSMGGNRDDLGYSIALNGSGNILITGYFQNVADFDPSAVSTAYLTSAGGQDIFIASYDGSGNYLWAKNMGGSGTDYGKSIALDATGNIYITGTFAVTADFDPATGTTANLTSFGNGDIFIAKYDVSGNYVWTRQIGGSNIELGNSLAIDGSGNICVTGQFLGTVDFDPSVSNAPLTSAGNNDLFLAKYDGSGNYLWAIKCGSTNFDIGYSLALDGSGNIYITGLFEGTVDFDPSGSIANLVSAGSYDIVLAKYDGSGNYVWAQKIGGASDDIGYATSVDGSGNVYMTGYFYGTVDFDPSASTVNLTSNMLASMCFAKLSSAGGYLLAGATQEPAGSDVGRSTVVDGSGNVYITGYFQGTADFDPTASTAYLSSTGVNADIFLAKYDAAGNYIWAKNMGGIGSDQPYSLAIDGAGYLYITGFYTGTADFDPSAVTTNLISAGGTDIFLAKYDGSGNYIWAKSMGGTTADKGNSLVLDGSGNVYVTGFFEGVADFDPAGPNTAHTSAGLKDIFIAKYDAAGNYVWAKNMGGTGDDMGNSIALNGSTNIYITGFFNGTADFDPSGVTNDLISGGASDIFIAKYDGSGNYTWAKRIGGTASEQANSIGIDVSGNIFITGNFAGTVDFDPSGVTVNKFINGADDIFLAKYDASGNYLWVNAIGWTFSDIGYALALDATGNVYITGAFQNAVNFSCALLGSSGGYDAFLSKYDASGACVWSKNIGGSNHDQAYSLALGTNGYMYLTGTFNGTADFNPSATASNQTSIFSDDIFIAKYRQCSASSSTQNTTACINYTWPVNSTTYSSGGTYYATIPNATGCDSVITLNLTINSPNTGTDVKTACGSYTWIDGNTYTSNNNTATKTLTNAAGCDSVVTLNLTIKNSTTGTDVKTACDSYTWIDGNTYTSNNNTATKTLTNAAGCDSVVTLNLTIKTGSTGTDVQTACDSYTWIDGNTYTSSNNAATKTLTNAIGCDSVVTLNLTIKNGTTGTDVQTACDSYTWIDGNTYTSSNNTATKTLTNAAGCDSVVTLNLTINTPDTSVVQTGNTLTANATVAGYQWIDCSNGNSIIGGANGQSYTPSANGSYAVIVTQSSCVDTSACFNVTITGITEHTKVILSVYPNPNNGSFTIKTNTEGTYSIVNNLGQVLQSVRLTPAENYTAAINTLDNGVYFIINDKGSLQQKIIVVK